VTRRHQIAVGSSVAQELSGIPNQQTFQVLINALTGQVGFSTQVTGYPTYQELRARSPQTDQINALEFGKCFDVRRGAGTHTQKDPDLGKLDLLR
jgi:hypothetical protein